MFDRSEDEAAVRCAVADILVALSHGGCADKMKNVKRLVEEAARIAKGELKTQEVEA